MKYLNSLAAGLILFSFASCDGNAENKEQQNQQLPSSTNTNPLLSPTTDTSNKTGQVALNPQHGEPGHRCDIAVGAPLNSPVNTIPQNTAPAITSPSNTNATALPASPATASGLNPQHGQPGHRCDIAVGAPLNSKPQ